MVQKGKIFERIRCGDEQAYQDLFRFYYENLVTFAYSLLRDLEKAEDVVQEFFVNFWYKKQYKNVHSSIDSYLFKAVKNICLNRIRDEKRQIRKLEQMEKEYMVETESDYETEADEKEAVYKAIAELPAQCRRIFMMCCVYGKKYQEVADILNISINTVRTQMGRAFKTLRNKLIQNKNNS